MPKYSPKFIVIEALDAGGSQTQTNLLVNKLKREKYQPQSYHFPQEDRATGRMIYDKFLLHQNKVPFSRREQSLLYIQDFYSQAENIQAVLQQKKGKPLVVSDRFYTSTLAYQTIGLSGKNRQQMLDWLLWLCEQDTPTLPKPDLVIFLDTPVEVSLARLAEKKKDYFESKDKLTAIRKSYLSIAAEQKWVTLSSVDEAGVGKGKPALHKEVWAAVAKIL